jgi:hypothetical protein
LGSSQLTSFGSGAGLGGRTGLVAGFGYAGVAGYGSTVVEFESGAGTAGFSGAF